MSETFERPPGFTYTSGKAANSVLHCEGVALSRLADQFDTPLYVYSAKTIRDRVAAFEKAFAGVRHSICYSVKANSNLSILRLLATLGCGFDVVSGGELDRVLRVDKRAAKKVVFSGVGKTASEIEAGIRAGILLFNLESAAELHAVAVCAAKLKRDAQIAFRVNPDVPADTHPYISTGLQKHKFGVPVGEARALYTKAAQSKYLRIAGVSVHIGSQITDFAPFGAAMKRVAQLVKELRADGHAIEYVDAGGGLGISYKGSQNFDSTVGKYADAIVQPLRDANVKVLLEPGRSIIGPAGILLTRVLYRKQNGEKKFVVVDAAMNDLIRPSLYQAEHQIVPVERNSTQSEIVDIVGPVCESGDFFARERNLSHTEQADLLAILDAGAYGMSLASNYNSRLRPAEILVDGKKAKLIRRRETISDLLRNELIDRGLRR
ncbi:MAG TPA: diaminopimelate decarboxylase [Terriglobales bacterium]|nr:diaminopimelate decarboxylase [Terriglobales bacterium]